ncbi:MAG: YbjN domain-containing protein [Actinomycetia bacterium]|nr:YbjN domain-containing protein [Actinomycetes bacterium]
MESPPLLSRIFGSGDDDRTNDLDKWLEDTLKQEFELDAIERDEDGDIPIPNGSAVVFVRTADDDPPRIEIFSPLLEDFTMRPEVYAAVNSINRKTPLAKAFVDPDNAQIVLTAELYIFDELSQQRLLAAIDLVADRADHYDSLLQKRFGGKTMFDDDEGDAIDV